MTRDLILAIDQGTTNTKALAVSPAGSVVARGAQATPVSYPQPGWVEQDARDIWRCTVQAIEQCLSQINTANLAAVAIANQRETALLWERASGQPVGPCVVWQCHRTASFCNELKAQGLDAFLHARSGLQVDPMFSASKIRWLLDHTPNGQARAADGELCAGTIDSWLLWNLTAGAVHATDLTNASRTQLLNLNSLAWDAGLLQIFGIPAATLPRLRPSSYLYAETVAAGSLPGGLPIAAMIGDSHASLYGLGGFRPGSVKTTYGTGSSLMTPTPAALWSRHGLSTTIAWARPGATYALEGNIYATGAAVQWLGDLLGLADAGAGVERLAHTVEDSGGVYFVPALVGLGAPHWNESARGLLTGITRGSGAGHLARATLEAIAFQVRDVFDVMRSEAGAPLETLLVDGGGSRNDLLVQLQADVLRCPVLRSVSSDVSPLGAAFLAGLAVGLWRDEGEIEQITPRRDRFEPRLPAEKADALYAGWQDAVARTVLPRAAQKLSPESSL